jgi:hypothetical protein
MAIVLILAAVVAWWLHKRGELVPNLLRLGGTLAAAVLALRMVETGRPLAGLVLGAMAFFWWKTQGGKTLVIGKVAKDLVAARALLGVGPDADAEGIQAAWRRGMMTAHPDGGGSDARAQGLTAARDLLLARAAARQPG